MFEGKEEKKCKEIKQTVVKRTTHNDCRECLLSRNMQIKKMKEIRSHRHKIFTAVIDKIALSANDDKRIIREDKISTFVHGHYE